jgi:hypothetical protein
MAREMISKDIHAAFNKLFPAYKPITGEQFWKLLCNKPNTDWKYTLLGEDKDGSDVVAEKLLDVLGSHFKAKGEFLYD